MAGKPGAVSPCGGQGRDLRASQVESGSLQLDDLKKKKKKAAQSVVYVIVVEKHLPHYLTFRFGVS